MPEIVALTHAPSRDMTEALRTFIDLEPIDIARVDAQHAAYRQALAEAGAEVVVLDVASGHPDAVFIEDTVIVLDELAVLTQPGAPARRAEVTAIAPTIRRYRAEVRQIALPGTLDGGDVLVVGKTLLVGLTTRTNAEGIAQLAAATASAGYRVLPVRVSGCLHLKSACTALPDGTLLVRAAHVAREDLAGFSRLEIADDEPSGANVVVVGDRIVMGASAPRTTAAIRARGFAVTTVDLSELAKAEGSATCLSILLTRLGR